MKVQRWNESNRWCMVRNIIINDRQIAQGAMEHRGQIIESGIKRRFCNRRDQDVIKVITRLLPLIRTII